MPVSDTTVLSGDTVCKCVSAGDINGSIQSFLWDTGAPGWDDTTTDSCRCFTVSGPDTAFISAGVQDNDGIIVQTGFKIKFGVPSSTPELLSPSGSIFLRLRDSSFQKGTVSFNFSASDSDLPLDTLIYSLYMGIEKGTREHLYSGTAPVYIAPDIDTGDYFVTIECSDAWNNTVTHIDSFSCFLKKDICFIGHSIIRGVGAPSQQGGFRQHLLDTLEDLQGNHHIFGCTGPLQTVNFALPQYDSCMAVSGAKSWGILDSLSYHPELNADIWILMIGVNDNYSYWEQRYTSAIIDTLHNRNTDSYIYVLNGLPYPDQYPQSSIDAMYSFNRMLDSIVTTKQSDSWNIRLVDAFKAIAPDSAFNQELFYDQLHPDEAGYAVIADEILKVMRQDWP
jgi:lysophospholipase L1-like esterase